MLQSTLRYSHRFTPPIGIIRTAKLGIAVAFLSSKTVTTAIGPPNSSSTSLSKGVGVGVGVGGGIFSLKDTSISNEPLQSSALSSSSYRPLAPEVDQTYNLVERYQVSSNSCRLRFSLPPGRKILGTDINLPTCIKVTLPGGTDVYGTGIPTSLTDVSKSYSPISHPSMEGAFELLVKGYPQTDDGIGTGGGVGAYLCSLRPQKQIYEDDSSGKDVPDSDLTSIETPSSSSTTTFTSIVASLKAPRIMHGSSNVYGRWKHVGLIAGGTGIAPLFQIVRMLIDDPSGYTTDIHLLFLNRLEEDILLRDEIDAMVQSSEGRFRVTYSLTSPSLVANDELGIEGSNNDPIIHNRKDNEFEYGRGSVDMVKNTLPPPMGGDGTTMVLVCGTDGFVEWWGGSVGRGPPKKNGSKGPKVQGPLLGLLKDAGYHESEVFKY